MIRKHKEVTAELKTLRYPSDDSTRGYVQGSLGGPKSENLDEVEGFAEDTKGTVDINAFQSMFPPSQSAFAEPSSEEANEDRLNSAGIRVWYKCNSSAVKDAGNKNEKAEKSSLILPPFVPLPTVEEQLHPKYHQGQRTRDCFAFPPSRRRSGAPPSLVRSRKSAPPPEIFKSFGVSMEDPVVKIIPAALKKHGIGDSDSSEYALYIAYEDRERCLGMHEQPLKIFKELAREGRKPLFILRRHPTPLEGWTGLGAGSRYPTAGSTEAEPEEKAGDLEAAGDPEAARDPEEAGDLEELWDTNMGDAEAESAEKGVNEISYSDEDSGSDDAIELGEGLQEPSAETEKRIVEDLLQQYTTWRPSTRQGSTSHIQIPGGIL